MLIATVLLAALLFVAVGLAGIVVRRGASGRALDTELRQASAVAWRERARPQPMAPDVDRRAA